MDLSYRPLPTSAMLHLVLLLVHCARAGPAYSPSPADPRVAIVGAGIGGSFTAAFLRDELGQHAQIDVYEGAATGGRTQVARVDNEMIEMGASIFCELNYYLRNWTDKLSLQRVPIGGTGSKSPDTLLSIYDGQSFVFRQSSWSAVTLYRMIKRYSFSYFYFKSAPVSVASRFVKYYELQQAGLSATSPQELLQAVNLYNLTQVTFQDDMQRLLGTAQAARLFMGELLAGINKVNYNQADLNALAGTVSMFPFVDDRLYHVEGGNYRLAVELLKYADAQLHQPAEVERIERQPSGKYKLTLATSPSSTCSDAEAGSTYDAVVIATPLELTNVSILGVNMPLLPARPFKRTVTTILTGQLRPSYFGVRKLPPGDTIMVTAAAQTPFSSISVLRFYANGTRLYKIFSSEPLPAVLLSALFYMPVVHALHDWLAYPTFHVPEAFAPFQLTEGLYYGNAWENAASAMEMSAVAARNSALLASRYLSNSIQPPLHK